MPVYLVYFSPCSVVARVEMRALFLAILYEQCSVVRSSTSVPFREGEAELVGKQREL